MKEGEGAPGLAGLLWRLLLWAGIGTALVVALSPLAGLAPAGAAGLGLGATPVLAAAVLAGWAVLAVDGRPPAALGFHLSRWAPGEAALGLALGIAVALAAVAAMAAAGGLAWSGEAGTIGGWMLAGAAAFWLFLAPAAAEEAVFRGYGFQALARSWGPWWALAVTSALFGVAHLWNPGATWPGALNVAGAGVLLGLVYLRTGSLWWATGVHLGWNWAHGFLVDLPVSGLEVVDAPMVEARARGPEWVSGGQFGPEGSLLATAALVAAVAWTVRTRSGWLRPAPATREAGPLALMSAPEGRSGGGATGGVNGNDADRTRSEST